MSSTGPGGAAASAADSNAAAAQRGLWDALDTTRCGHPEVVEAFLAGVPAGARIVDVGCWNGAIGALAATAVGGGGDPEGAPWRSYVGVDVVPEAVAEFERRHAGRPRTEAVAGDARKLPFETGAADVVLCLFVLQDLPRRTDGVTALRELSRVAATEAPVLLGLTVHESRDEETSYVVRKLRAEGIPEKPTYHWRRDDLFEAVRTCGLEVESVHDFGPNERGFVELYVHLRRQQATTVPIRILPGVSSLFVDYICEFDRVGDLFAHDYRNRTAFHRTAEAAAARDLPREQLVALLLEQNRRFGSGRHAMANAGLLADPGTVAVVTGQQPGLFGGPLYNLYKAATAIRLADVLTERSDRPHVPVFWIASDDHQVGEVDHVHAIDRSGGPVRISWERGRSRRVEPIAALNLDDGVLPALERVAEIAAGRPHGRSVLELLGDCFRPGERLAEAFARLAARLFDGLVLVESSDPALRRLGMPALAPELAYPSPATAAARHATEEVEARGYAVQVPLRDDSLNLFFGSRERFRVRSGPEGFRVELRSSVVDGDVLRARFDAETEQFSPNVLLRPLYQDALFPTVAYVAGPSEIAYFAQLAPVYARFGIPMPIVYPRKSVTLLDQKVGALLRASELSVEDVLAGAEAPAAAVASLLPDGQPQERVLGLVHALLTGGTELVHDIVAGIDLDEFHHQVLDIGAGRV